MSQEKSRRGAEMARFIASLGIGLSLFETSKGHVLGGFISSLIVTYLWNKFAYPNGKSIGPR